MSTGPKITHIRITEPHADRYVAQGIETTPALTTPPLGVLLIPSPGLNQHVYPKLIGIAPSAQHKQLYR